MDRQGSLVRIIALFKRSGGVLPVQQIADELGKKSEVVEGMLETLVQIGVLEQAEAPVCEVCPMRGICSPTSVGTRCYRLTA